MNEIVLGMMLFAAPAVTMHPPAEPAAPMRWENPRPAIELPRVVVADPPPRWRLDPPRRAQAATASQPTSRLGRVIGTAVGAFAGFMIGGVAGYAVASDRDADDDGVSGLRGVVIGAPIGAAVGAMIGYQLTK